MRFGLPSSSQDTRKMHFTQFAKRGETACTYASKMKKPFNYPSNLEILDCRHFLIAGISRKVRRLISPMLMKLYGFQMPLGVFQCIIGVSPLNLIKMGFIRETLKVTYPRWRKIPHARKRETSTTSKHTISNWCLLRTVGHVHLTAVVGSMKSSTSQGVNGGLPELSQLTNSELGLNSAGQAWNDLLTLARQPGVCNLGQGFPDYEGSSVARAAATEALTKPDMVYRVHNATNLIT